MAVSSCSLRAARALLGKTQKQVSDACGVARQTIVRLENGSHLRDTDSGRIVADYYEKLGLKFLDDDDETVIGVRWKRPGVDDKHRRTQIHAARMLVGLTQPELAELAGVGRTTLTRFESGMTSEPAILMKKALRQALEARKIALLPDTPYEGFGVSIRRET